MKKYDESAFRLADKKPKLLLHVCCAPCLTAVFDQLNNEFDITIFWFNPNIYPEAEYFKRLFELKKYSNIIKTEIIVDEKYLEESFSWNCLAKKYSKEPEGGKRCELCFKYRLLKTAQIAQKNDFDYFATTLTVSPHKNAETINEIGLEIADKIKSVSFLNRNFKKNDNYRRSIELCREFNIYRQKYCGCQYSLEN